MTEEQKKTKLAKISKERPILNEIGLTFRRIGAYIVAALKDFRRSPMTIFFTVAYPIILILLFGAIFSEGNTSFNAYELYIQSEGDDGFYLPGIPPQFLNFTGTLITTLDEIETNDSEPYFDLKYIPLKDEHNTSIDPGLYLEEMGGYICLVIPNNLTQKMIFNAPVNLTIIVVENSQSSSIALSILSNVIYNLNLAFNGSKMNLGMETFDIYLEEQIDYFEFLIPGMIGVAIMNNAVIGTLNRYTYFHRLGFFKKLSSSPMKKGDVVAGETIWQLIQGIISIIAIILIGWLVFKIPQGDFTWAFKILDWKIIPITISAVMCFTGLGMIAARLVRNPDAGTAAGNFLTFPMMFLSGAFFDVSGIPVVNIISKMLPLTYMVDAYRASMITNNISIAWTNIGISLAFGIVIMIIGIIVTRLSER